MARPYVLLVAGHRSKGDGGSDTERQLTDDLAIAYRDTFRAAGYRADILQELETGDPRGLVDGGLTGLTNAAARRLRKANESLKLMFDLHFNTASSPVHAIVAHNRRQDGRGALSSGFPQGNVADDVMANNTLDVDLAFAIAAEISKIPGMRNRPAGLSGKAGVMLENETGVGDPVPPFPNSRLGIMGGTADLRLDTVRLTIEHGGTEDAQKKDFFLKCAKASLKATETVLKDRLGEVIEEGPVDPEAPVGDPGSLSVKEWAFGSVAGYSFNADGPISRLWVAYSTKNGRWPRLIDVRDDESGKFFLFSDGLLLGTPAGESSSRQIEVAS